MKAKTASGGIVLDKRPKPEDSLSSGEGQNIWVVSSQGISADGLPVIVEVSLSVPEKDDETGQLVEKFLVAAMKKALHSQLEDGTWWAEIPGFKGVWANAGSLKGCLEELKEVLHEWLLLKREHQDRDIPIIEEINLNDVK
jgi:predicted RNase H-like HicB family nuclease